MSSQIRDETILTIATNLIDTMNSVDCNTETVGGGSLFLNQTDNLKCEINKKMLEVTADCSVNMKEDSVYMRANIINNTHSSSMPEHVNITHTNVDICDNEEVDIITQDVNFEIVKECDVLKSTPKPANCSVKESMDINTEKNELSSYKEKSKMSVTKDESIGSIKARDYENYTDNSSISKSSSHNSHRSHHKSSTSDHNRSNHNSSSKDRQRHHHHSSSSQYQHTSSGSKSHHHNGSSKNNDSLSSRSQKKLDTHNATNKPTTLVNDEACVSTSKCDEKKNSSSSSNNHRQHHHKSHKHSHHKTSHSSSHKDGDQKHRHSLSSHKSSSSHHNKKSSSSHQTHTSISNASSGKSSHKSSSKYKTKHDSVNTFDGALHSSGGTNMMIATGCSTLAKNALVNSKNIKPVLTDKKISKEKLDIRSKTNISSARHVITKSIQGNALKRKLNSANASAIKKLKTAKDLTTKANHSPFKRTPKKARNMHIWTGHPLHVRSLWEQGVKNKTDLDFCIKNTSEVVHLGVENLKYAKLIHMEEHPNGSATVIHTYQDELNSLDKYEMKEFAKEFFKVCISNTIFLLYLAEHIFWSIKTGSSYMLFCISPQVVFCESSQGVCSHVMGIVHGGCTYMPDFVEYMSEHYPNLPVKVGVLGKSDIETTNMSRWADDVTSSYSCGTFRHGGLNQLSVVGTKQEEAGGYFPDILKMIEQSKFLKVCTCIAHNNDNKNNIFQHQQDTHFIM